jgi:hypothetical protein
MFIPNRFQIKERSPKPFPKEDKRTAVSQGGACWDILLDLGEDKMGGRGRIKMRGKDTRFNVSFRRRRREMKQGGDGWLESCHQSVTDETNKAGVDMQRRRDGQKILVVINYHEDKVTPR